MKQLQLNLDDTWDECLKMWRWIVRHLEEYDYDIFGLKRAYITQVWQPKHQNIKTPKGNCFLCDRHTERMRKCRAEGSPIDCPRCPGVLVDINFDCMDINYNYSKEPRLFLKKLESLNKVRKLKIKQGQIS